MNKLPVIYVAGPYRGPNREAIDLNITAAKQVGMMAVRKGWSPVIPHMNTAHMDQLINLPDQFWLDATMELLLRCDAVVLCPGWETSIGTKWEIEAANTNSIPVFYSTNNLVTAHSFIESLTQRQA